MNEQEAIRQTVALFAGYGIECSEEEAKQLIEIGMRSKVMALYQKLTAA